MFRIFLVDRPENKGTLQDANDLSGVNAPFWLMLPSHSRLKLSIHGWYTGRIGPIFFEVSNMSRAREFEETEVMDKAVETFWRQGYEGTSLNDLLEATGLTKSSLYATFGSKEDLFYRVVERYLSKHVEFRQACALAEPTPRRIVERLLNGMADLHAGSRTPPGCLVTSAALSCSPQSEPVRQYLVRGRNEFGRILRDRLEEAAAAGPLPAGLTADDAARLVVLTIQGMAVEAKCGATRNQLRKIVRAFLLGWPEG